MPEDKFYYKNIPLEKLIEYKDSHDLPLKQPFKQEQTLPKISARDIMPFVEETLDKLGMTERKVRPAYLDYAAFLNYDFLGQDKRIFVDGILVDIQSNEVFKHAYQQLYGESAIGILGYALPYFKPKEARIRDVRLDTVMRTTGHELGHLFTPDLLCRVEEEAKAYAFECAWCKAIKNHNIANLKDIIRRPSFLSYNRAEQFVDSLIQEGHDPLQLYWDIAHDEGVFYPMGIGSLTTPLKCKK